MPPPVSYWYSTKTVELPTGTAESRTSSGTSRRNSSANRSTSSSPTAGRRAGQNRRIATAHGWTIDVTESEAGGRRLEFGDADLVDAADADIGDWE